MIVTANKPTDLSILIYKFFGDYLIQNRRLSHNTVSAYRDSIRLYLLFLSERVKRPVARLCVDDMQYASTLDFLQHLEDGRHNSVRTRNGRLAAIKCFSNYVAIHMPEAMPEASKILSIPQKTWGRPLIDFLDRAEIESLVSAADTRTWSGQRDQVMLLLLYNTGARVSEMTALKVQDVDLKHQHTACLYGKGRKERVVPLWSRTVTQLKCWLPMLPSEQPNAPLFPNRFGHPMTRSGVRKRLNLLQKKAVESCPSLGQKCITPHIIRHTTAMHLLQSGVDLSLIALWLGHEQIQTTHQYMTANLEMKKTALASLEPIEIKGHGKMKEIPESLLAYLESL
ncbi:MAG: integrase [Oceanospirillales bacterium]|nr:MAG: integrase [Oceanospirillales bacterium]